MGIWASFLDLLWPSRDDDAKARVRAAEAAAPQGPLNPGDAALSALDDWADGIIDEHFRKKAEAATNASWREWPVEQWAPAAERTLRRITGSRGLKRGGGNSTKPRAVVDPAGVHYPSVRAAAKACGVAPSTVWDQVVEGRNGWRYAD